MGVSLSYRTVGPVPATIRECVVRRLQDESAKREWWAESILLFEDPHAPEHILGDTKLFCLLDDDDRADCYMAMKDAEFIVEQLEFVSRDYGIAWRLSLAGESAGEIRNGRRDEIAQQFLDSFDLFSDDDDVDFGQYDREALLRRYADR